MFGSSKSLYLTPAITNNVVGCVDLGQCQYVTSDLFKTGISLLRNITILHACLNY